MAIDGLDLNRARSQRLHASAQALLYDIAKRVRSGYHWWMTGDLPVEKVLGVTAKFVYQFETDVTAAQRHYRKKNGDASCILFVWPLRHDSAGYTTRFGYLLLATEHIDGEVMYDGRRRPVRCSLYADGNAVFHLIPTQVTVEKKLRKPGPKVKKKSLDESAKSVQTQSKVAYVFDWQLSAKSLEHMQERFLTAVSNPVSLQRLRRAYQNLPMTRGYRNQFKKVLTDTKAAWKRATTPAVMEAKKAIKEGSLPDPFSISALPFIRGFPILYDDPPMTLGTYLNANEKARREVEKKQLGKVRSDHADHLAIEGEKNHG